jgi:hypothetical protein
MSMEPLDSIRFLNNQLVWQPLIIASDGRQLGNTEFFVSESPSEVQKTLAALLRTIELQGADILQTLNREASLLRREANNLSDFLRQSRSTKEAVINGQRLQAVMLLLRMVEAYQHFYSAKKTGTSGD